MAFVWDQNLATGNPLIDSQHRQLIDAVNALYYAHQSGKGRQEVERTMEFLMEYTSKHFADEEKLQEKYDYPDYPIHKRIHNEFKKVALELASELTHTDEFISHVYVTVSEWLVHHIRGDDFKMAAYIQNKIQAE